MDQFRQAFSRLDHCLVQRMQAYHTPALVFALTDRDRLVHLSALGHADMEKKTPVTAGHLFAIGSIGKSFTGVAVLQACDAGLLDLRAPVTDYLPWFSVQSRFEPITLHHLLTHSAGIPRGTEFSPDPRAEVYALRDQEIGFAPGAHYNYSDIGYKMLGLVLEAVTGKRYADLIREMILEPLEMTNTFAITTNDLRPRMAIGYRPLHDDRPSHPVQPLVPADWVETNSGDGCIVSTAEDMAKYARMLLNEGAGPRGQVLSEASYQKLIFPMIEDDGEAYSYGLYLFEDDGYRHAGHGGDVPGYEAYLWLDLDNSLGTIVMCTTPYTPRASFLAMEYFREAYLNHALPDEPPLPDFTHIADPCDYAGIYRSADGEMVLEAQDHHLMLVFGDRRLALEDRGIDHFYANHPDWNRYPIVFTRNSRGEVVEVSHGPHWFAGQRYEGPRDFTTPQEWSAYTGHYRSHNPWYPCFRVFTRKGQLILAWPAGDEEILVRLSEGCFRIGEEEYLPERLVFDQVVEGKALRATRSGSPYYRFFTE